MKKIIAALCMLFSFNLHAQYKYFTLGIEGGPNYSFQNKLDGVNSYNKQMPGYCMSTSLLYRLNSRVAFKAILSYEKKTTYAYHNYQVLNDPEEYVVGVFDNSWNVYLDRNYICLPLMVTYYGGDKRHFFIQTGPYIGMLLNANVRVINEIASKTVEFKTDYTHEKRLDFGCSVSFGWELPLMKNLNFLFGLRQNIGFNTLSNIPITKGEKQINSTNIFIGVNYRLGK